MTAGRWLPVVMLVTGCALGSPMSGPGLDGEAEGPYIAVATHTRFASGQQKAFADHVAAVNAQMDAQPGFVARALRARILGRERWTLTVWEDEESLLEFAYGAGAHATAIGDAGTVIEGVYSAQWEVEPEDLPIPWDVALEHLAAERATPPWEE
ncbi:MAG: DUF3291 domain-containing protein [Alphaproteobacteria bacterium]|nr:DUF3291 domain-containing protein [Alphaproteobacteria bacterium]